MYTIKTNSLLYHFLQNYGGGNLYRRKDLCSVIRGIFRGILYACFIVCLGVFIVSMSLAWLLPVIAGGLYLIQPGDFAAMSVALAFLFYVVFPTILLILYVGDNIIHYAKKKLNPKFYSNEDVQETFLSTWYDGFKNKYCPRVEYLHPDD